MNGERLTKRPGPEESLHQESSRKSAGHLAYLGIIHVDEQGSEAAYPTFGGWCFLYELNLSESKGWLDELGKRCLYVEDSLIRSGAKGNESSKIIKIIQNQSKSAYLTECIDIILHNFASFCAMIAMYILLKLSTIHRIFYCELAVCAMVPGSKVQETQVGEQGVIHGQKSINSWRI